MHVLAKYKYGHLTNIPINSRAFTLIELLIVIAVVAALAGIILIGINPQDKLNLASDSKVMNDIGAIASAEESFATSNLGFYSPDLATMVTSKDLRVAPSAPSGYSAYAVQLTPASCTSATCTSVIWTGQLKAAKYSTTPYRRYESLTGKVCNRADTTTVCP